MKKTARKVPNWTEPLPFSASCPFSVAGSSADSAEAETAPFKARKITFTIEVDHSTPTQLDIGMKVTTSSADMLETIGNLFAVYGAKGVARSAS